MEARGPGRRCFDGPERERIAAALDAQVPGSTELGAVEYVEGLLTALHAHPPRVWASPGGWLDLGPWERHAWSQRIAELHEVYRRVGAGADLEPGDDRVLLGHAIEATYGDPAYGGNRNEGGWRRIEFPTPLFPPTRDGG